MIMTSYQISYDLQSPGQDYEDLHDAIKSLGDYCHILESTWLVEASDTSASDIRDELKKHIDSNDRLIVTRPRSGWATTFSDDGTDWMYDNL